MTDPLPSEDITVSSDRSLKKLAWAIEESQGQFKLILARCNYGSLRSRLVERLQEPSASANYAVTLRSP